MSGARGAKTGGSGAGADWSMIYTGIIHRERVDGLISRETIGVHTHIRIYVGHNNDTRMV